nr:hypothetical protein CFP56_67576 [Quercus suber]
MNISGSVAQWGPNGRRSTRKACALLSFVWRTRTSGKTGQMSNPGIPPFSIAACRPPRRTRSSRGDVSQSRTHTSLIDDKVGRVTGIPFCQEQAIASLASGDSIAETIGDRVGSACGSTTGERSMYRITQGVERARYPCIVCSHREKRCL